MANPKRKNRGRKVLATVLIIIAVLIGVGAIAVKFLREKVTSAYGTKNSDEIKTASVTVGSISTTISGSGVLTEQETTSVTLPSGVAAQSILVKENDTVEAGQKIANVRMASVLTAINAAQETLDDLDSQISEASKDTVDTYVRSSVKGRVKKIYCKAGDSVLSVMYEHNALMILSLDGYLAFEIDAGTLKAGSSVNVKLAKGGTYKGKVESISGEKAVVLITDDKPLVGDTATASDSKGNVLGSGELYIHQPLSVTGYAGTVSRVNVAENRIVYAKGILLTLKDTAFTANYESLLEQRAEMESDFNELVQLYQAGAVYAPIAGKIQTVTEEEDSENTEDTWELTVIVPQEQMIVTAAVDESDILSVSVGQEADVTVNTSPKASSDYGRRPAGTMTLLTKAQSRASGSGNRSESTSRNMLSRIGSIVCLRRAFGTRFPSRCTLASGATSCTSIRMRTVRCSGKRPTAIF